MYIISFTMRIVKFAQLAKLFVLHHRLHILCNKYVIRAELLRGRSNHHKAAYSALWMVSSFCMDCEVGLMHELSLKTV